MSDGKAVHWLGTEGQHGEGKAPLTTACRGCPSLSPAFHIAVMRRTAPEPEKEQRGGREGCTEVTAFSNSRGPAEALRGRAKAGAWLGGWGLPSGGWGVWGRGREESAGGRGWRDRVGVRPSVCALGGVRPSAVVGPPDGTERVGGDANLPVERSERHRRGSGG